VPDARIGTIEVIVTLTPEAAVLTSAQQRALRAHAAQGGFALAPLHPSTSDPDLAVYAVAHVDAASADAAVQHFLRCDGVVGAYVKPHGAPPERSAQHVRQPL